MNNILIKMLPFLILCFLFISCENKNEYEGQITRNTEFTVSTGYIKLSEDSMEIAGVLHVTANVPVVKLRWNVLPECNIDTTVTSLSLKDGAGVLPIKWNKRLANGKYNIQERMFDAGVKLIAGEDSKYVHLVWADGIDSTALIKTPVTTRAAEVLAEEAILLNVSPTTISMDPLVGGAARVNFSGIDMIIVDQSRVETETNIDKSAIPLIMEKPGPLIFKWNSLGPPTKDFIATVTLYAGEVYKDLYIKYTISPEDPTYWEYLYCIPEKNTHIPAKNASIRVYVKTNAQWGLNSLQSSFPIEENATSLGTKLLAIDIDDNPGPNTREVKVNVNSNGVQKEVLTFTQEAPDATFQVISVTPEDNTLLSSDATTMTVKVRTDHDWWIQYGGKKYIFESKELGERIGSITIPTNIGEDVKNHTVIIGYGDKVEQIVNYYQEGKTSDSGTEFTFISSVPANNASIPAEETIVTVKVKTDYAWWIELDGLRTNLPAGPLSEKTGTITIPANMGATNKTITVTVGHGTTTEKTLTFTQLGSGGGETVTPGRLTPTGDLSEYGTTCSCTFTGNFAGTIIMRAKTGESELARTSATVGTLSVFVPELFGMNRVITFEYSIDGGNNWLPLGERNQINETFAPGSIFPSVVRVPSKGGEFTWNYRGTYSKEVKFEVSISDNNGNFTVISTQSATAPQTFKVTVPANSTSYERDVRFRYWTVKVFGGGWQPIMTMPQANQ